MSDALHSEKIAFDEFGTLQGVLAGQPFRIFPEGKWYRDNRVLDITPARLKEFAANMQAGMPNFKVPINLDHSKDKGKVGTIDAVAYLPQGPDGAGLYATKYTLTDKGKEAITKDGYDAVSGEAVWTLFDGAKYQDPKTGKNFDNVLAGVALTPTPFFGKEVQLFSAKPITDSMADNSSAVIDKPKRGNGYTALREKMKSYFADMLKMFDDNNGNGEPDATEGPEIEIEIKPKGSMPEGMSALPVNPPPTPTPPVADIQEGKHSMADPITTPAPAAPETFSVSADEFAALKAKAEKADKLETEFAATKTQLETFAAQLADEKKARRLEQLTDRYETFSIDKPATLAEKFAALETVNPELFKYFDGLLETVAGQLRQSALFAQFSKENTGVPASEDFDGLTKRIVKEEFGGDMAKYTDAAGVAAKRRPDLFAEYRGQAIK